MKLFCKKCKAQVTNDLVKAKTTKWQHNYMTEIVDEELELEKHTYKKGQYHLSTAKFYFPIVLRNVVYVVNPDEVLQELTTYRGCCSYDMADITCVCGEYLGKAKDDCWQDTVAHIQKVKVFKGDIK